MYRDDKGILSLVIKNVSAPNSAIQIFSVKTVTKCLRKLNGFFLQI